MLLFEDLKDLLTLHGKSLMPLLGIKGCAYHSNGVLNYQPFHLKSNYIDEMFKDLDITASGTAKSNAVTMLNDETQTSFSAFNWR